jgi:hypothetical protein
MEIGRIGYPSAKFVHLMRIQEEVLTQPSEQFGGRVERHADVTRV